MAKHEDKSFALQEVTDDAEKGSISSPVLVEDSLEFKRLLRKIDFRLMPLMCFIYGIQFLDKTTLSYASVMGIKKDTHLVGNDYALLGTMFYVGYLFWEYPTNYLMQRLPLAKYLAINIIIWGGVLACTAAAKNWAGLMLVRTFLGIFESTVTPGFVLITSQWYRRAEQPLRIGIWYSFNGWAQIFGGCVAYGVAKHVGSDPHAALKGWQIIFIFTGCLTILLGIGVFFYLPDRPSNARWLTEEERLLAVERTRSNQQAVENKTVKWYQFREALTDVNTWLYALFSLATNIPNGAITNFGNILITSFGYSSRQSLLLGTPAGAVEIVWILFFAWLATRTNQRMYTALLSFIVPLIGLIMVASAKHVTGLIGYYLIYGYPVGSVLILSLISANTAGYTKKVTVNAINLIAYCVGNIIGPQTFQAKDSPDYKPAKIAMVICFGVCMLDFMIIRYLAVRENKRRDSLLASGDLNAGKIYGDKEAGILDLTDRENLSFRYNL
ncbi:putative MFS allantoate transporter [Taphrina deformans PYCC 5710]|uniref:MFS allantoate transporter n=1 Tax=Taphrina deformans (strain PYCC 5710 / ATCC 11124 / CBS 356.35 / IMI 108563 / JCM 9778 / NBRC 8474) TaxID=1097556 RepID=R4X7T2_TAPDE|nr:putative MFS allantoate transporter [Taphrina deformans PYCC 5710]|eukprot:CCG81506.1 putative MFS allantoate transporter [Taphrina deformans PYCC 5710]